MSSRGYADAGVGAEAGFGEESPAGVPLLVRGELIGVLCIESDRPYRSHEEDKQTIELPGSYLAIAIQNMPLLERAETADVVAGPAVASASASDTRPVRASAATTRTRAVGTCRRRRPFALELDCDVDLRERA